MAAADLGQLNLMLAISAAIALLATFASACAPCPQTTPRPFSSTSPTRSSSSATSTTGVSSTTAGSTAKPETRKKRDAGAEEFVDGNAIGGSRVVEEVKMMKAEEESSMPSNSSLPQPPIRQRRHLLPAGGKSRENGTFGGENGRHPFGPYRPFAPHPWPRFPPCWFSRHYKCRRHNGSSSNGTSPPNNVNNGTSNLEPASDSSTASTDLPSSESSSASSSPSTAPSSPSSSLSPSSYPSPPSSPSPPSTPPSSLDAMFNEPV